MIKRAERLHSLMPLLALLAFCGVFLLSSVVIAAERAAQGGGAPVFLVLPFQINEGSPLTKAADELPVTLAEQLNSRGIQTVSPATMMRLLQEQKVTTLDTETVRRLARAAGATHGVYGNISQMGDTLSVDARLVSATGNEKPRPVYVEKHGISTSLNPAADELSSRLSSVFARKGSLAAVEVRGTRVLDPEVVLMRINTKKGDAIDSSAIDAEVKRVWELGYFSDVRVEIENRPQGPVLVYTVVEKPRIDSVSVEGSSEVSEEDILAALGSKAGAIVNDKLIAEDIQKILEMYRKKGFYQASVTSQTHTRASGESAAVVFQVNEGKEMYIREVKLTGVSQLDESDVRDEMLLSERGMISWITGTGVLKEELIERDTSAIANYYMNRGFMDVVVGAPNIDYKTDGIYITFPITEGQRYTLGKVTFDGDLIAPEAEFKAITELHKLAAKGDYFNLAVMQEDARKISDYYGDYGYGYAEVNPTPTKQGNTVDIAYNVMKKQKITVRRVTVEGNTKTRDNVILREMRVTDGQQYDGQKLRRSTSRLNKLGYFETVETELVATESPDQADLKVKVKERPTGALMAGIGYSTFSNVGLTGTVMENNLWGKGYQVSLQAATSSRRDALTFSFTNPRWNDTPLSVGTDIYHWRDDYIDYRKRTTGGVLRFAYPLGEYTSIGWGYRADFYKLYDVDDDASKLIRDYATGDRVSSVLFSRIVRDTTDQLRPTTGNIDKLGVEYGGGIIAGDDDFITVTAEHQTYYELMRNHVLHGRVKGSAIFTNGSDEVPVFERFWMGGMESVRGYDSRDIVPRDPETGDRIGGTRMAFANLEYIWTFSNEFGLNLVPFFDVGFNIDKDRSYSWSDEIKKSYGAELRWRSPMGDLRFAYGIPLDDNRNGKRDSGRFEFSMGRFF